VSEIVSGAFLLIGAAFALLAAVGVLRMPDVFTRMQASTKASTLGLACLLVGLSIRHPDTGVVIRAVSIAAFTMLTTSVAAHVIARAAARARVPLWEGTLVDERPSEPDRADDPSGHASGTTA
jgi:multicomponent Na+:H+ antiporter subunit G